MPPALSKLKREKLSSQTREVVYNVITYMEKEAKNGTLSVPIEKAEIRAAEATGVSRSTIQKIK